MDRFVSGANLRKRLRLPLIMELGRLRRRTFRTTFRDNPNSRQIALIGLPWTKTNDGSSQSSPRSAFQSRLRLSLGYYLKGLHDLRRPCEGENMRFFNPLAVAFAVDTVKGSGRNRCFGNKGPRREAYKPTFDAWS
jgi:hypothetical protein